MPNEAPGRFRDDLLEAVIGQVTDGILVTDTNGVILHANARAAAHLHVREETLVDLPIDIFGLAPDLCREGAGSGSTPTLDWSVRCLGAGDQRLFVWCLCARRERQVEERVRERTDDLHTIVRALLENERRMSEVQRIAHVGDWKWDIESGSLTWSEETYRIFGLDPEHFHPTYDAFLSFVHPDDRATVANAISRAIGDGEDYRLEHRIVRADGGIAVLYERGEIEHDAEGKPVAMLGVVQDITERKLDEEKLVYYANYDPLTGLPNRSLFQDRLRRALARARRRQTLAALVFIDLDRFKTINDSLGHHIGDKLLIEAAGRIRNCLRESDTVARFGGDEFVLIIEDIPSPDAAGRTAQKIVDAFATPFEIDGHSLFSGVSAGVSIFPLDEEDIDGLIRQADAAMYRAKHEGGNGYQYFTPDMRAHAIERLRIENNLRRALQEDGFELYYQPQIDLGSGKVTGVEALLRWRDPVHGLMSPAEFIPVAEETGLILPIGEWVLRMACHQMKAWQQQGIAPNTVAVNLSPVQFRRHDLPDTIAAVLAETGLDPAHLELEVTESMLIDHFDSAVDMLGRLRALGVGVSLDDFGTGYSSLSYLSRLPVSTLKIDRSFVRNLLENRDDAAIAEAIITLSHTLRLLVTAEGVETDEQLHFLRERGCDSVQGFLLGHPLPADRTRDLLRASAT